VDFGVLVVLERRNTWKKREIEGQRSLWLLIRSWEILGLSCWAVGLEYFLTGCLSGVP